MTTKTAPTKAALDLDMDGVFNPRILDASIRDVASCLSDGQKADVLLHAMEHLPCQVRSRTVIENAVQSCLQVAPLSSANTAKARIIRAKARLASGSPVSAEQDIQAALVVEPDNYVAKSLSQRRTMTWEKTNHTLTADSSKFSVEIWREIALFLPRRSLLALLWVPHALSRIASQLLFRKVDLHFSGWVPLDEDDAEEDTWNSDGHVPDKALDSPYAQRSADILTHFIIDPSFSSLVKTLRIHAVTRDNGSIAFQTAMLANALPKLVNLRNVHCVANYEDLVPILRLVRSSCPRLQGLSLIIYRTADAPAELNLPEFNHLKHFSYTGTGQNSAPIQGLLNQNRDTLQKVSLNNKLWMFPGDFLHIRNLTHLDFEGQIPAESEAFSEILSNGHQLEYLKIHCVLKCHASAQFRAHLTSLPFLSSFSFSVLSIHRLVNDPDIFPAISEFLRGRSHLRALRLTVCDSETVQRAVGYDASVWGVLPSLPNIKNLSITYPKGLAPGLASWLIPRGLLSLGLDSLKLPSREPETFLNQLRTGIPPTLRSIALKNLSCSTVAEIIEEGFPMVRLISAGENYWSVRRGNGTIEMEQWSKRRVEYHASEWLEWLGCEERIQDFTQFD